MNGNYPARVMDAATTAAAETCVGTQTLGPYDVWLVAESAWARFVRENPGVPTMFEQARLFIAVFSFNYATAQRSTPAYHAVRGVV